MQKLDLETGKLGSLTGAPLMSPDRDNADFVWNFLNTWTGKKVINSAGQTCPGYDLVETVNVVSGNDDRGRGALVESETGLAVFWTA